MVIGVDSWDDIIEEDIQNIIFYPILNQFQRFATCKLSSKFGSKIGCTVAYLFNKDANGKRMLLNLGQTNMACCSSSRVLQLIHFLLFLGVGGILYRPVSICNLWKSPASNKGTFVIIHKTIVTNALFRRLSLIYNIDTSTSFNTLKDRVKYAVIKDKQLYFNWCCIVIL